MLSENGDVIKIDTIRCQTTRLRVSKSENDTKTLSVDANLLENGAKQLRFRLKTD